MGEQKVFNVRLFGGFSMDGMGGELTSQTMRSPMLTRLLLYILCHHKERCDLYAMADAMWADGESDNPMGALKNLTYRLRTVLSKVWPGVEFIRTGRGFYQWNPSLEISVDVERFEGLLSAAKANTDPMEKVLYLQQALGLYGSGYMSELRDVYWVTLRAERYRSDYLRAAKELCTLLEQQKRYPEMEHCSARALEEEKLDAELHYWFLRALYGQKKITQAMEHYRTASNLLYDNLGVPMSEESQTLYQTMLSQMHECAADVQSVLSEIVREEQTGAFICEFGVFRMIYALEKASAQRLGISVYLALITVEPGEQATPDSAGGRARLGEAMRALQAVLSGYLRSGDVVSRYSDRQYIVMLPSCQYESALKVQRRIETRFYGSQAYGGAHLEFEFSEVI